MNQRAWRPAPFVMASLIVAVAALIVLWFVPPWRLWALAVLLLNFAASTLAGLLPRCALLGENLTRLPPAAAQRGEVALTFDDGPDPEITPQVLHILDQHQIRATFFCIGEKAAAHPDLCRAMLARGHRLENHGQRHHTLLAFSGSGGWRREIGEAQKILERLGGQPRFFRPLAGLRNPMLDAVLHAAGLRLASWTRRGYDTRCGDADAVLARLTRHLAAGDILLLHDGNAARDAQGMPVVFTVLPRLLAELSARNLHPVPLDA
ncbi:MAG: polysaccharide deacetylase family protein [Desulfobulbus sp.]|nr:polysaccharide deacetylase family protein [Desulfobulbus sp.]